MLARVGAALVPCGVGVAAAFFVGAAVVDLLRFLLVRRRFSAALAARGAVSVALGAVLVARGAVLVGDLFLRFFLERRRCINSGGEGVAAGLVVVLEGVLEGVLVMSTKAPRRRIAFGLTSLAASPLKS